MRYYLIAGEASGDLHGANLMKGIKESDPAAEFRFWGGDKMAETGGKENLVRHYRESAFMGLTEIIKNLKTILSQISMCKEDILSYCPNAVILIDYAGFNMRIAKFAKKHGIRTIYYIAPKVWAWNESRVKGIKKYVDNLLVIFPFEIDYFRKHGIEAIYEGNPLMDAIEQRRSSLIPFEQFVDENNLDGRPIIALLAGSRRSEIGYNLPFMANVAHLMPEYQFVVAGVSWLDKEVYDKILEGTGIKLVHDKTYELLNVSTASIVTSGTATLETALLGTPEIVCYRKDVLSVAIGRMLIKINFVSLVNIILGREAVRELLQDDMTVDNALNELQAILPGGTKSQKLKDDYSELHNLIGSAGASGRFGQRIVEIVKQN